MKSIIEAIIDCIKVKIVKRKFYAKFCVVMTAAFSIKFENGEKNYSWKEGAPSIYDIDNIIDKMNEERDFLNKTYRLKVVKWTRDDVRPFIDLLHEYHYKMSKCRGKELSCIETAASLIEVVEMSWVKLFKCVLKMHQALDT